MVRKEQLPTPKGLPAGAPGHWTMRATSPSQGQHVSRLKQRLCTWPTRCRQSTGRCQPRQVSGVRGHHHSGDIAIALQGLPCCRSSCLICGSGHQPSVGDCQLLLLPERYLLYRRTIEGLSQG
jgi:hypothetical protein